MTGEVQKLAIGIDRYCARLNPGLTAIAIVLGTIVLASAADRTKPSIVLAPALTGPADGLDFENPGIGD
jgi:hypothetical protein